MQISRHWRLNAQRYRLQGVRFEDGSVSLQNRPGGPTEAELLHRSVYLRELSTSQTHNLGEGTRRTKESAA